MLGRLCFFLFVLQAVWLGAPAAADANGGAHALDRASSLRHTTGARRDRALRSAARARASLVRRGRTLWRSAQRAAGARARRDAAVLPAHQQQFRTALGQVAQSAVGERAPLSSEALAPVYLFVPGFLARHYGAPLGAARARMESLGATGFTAGEGELARFGFDTDGSIEANADALGKMIEHLHERTGRKVFVVPHSSGAVSFIELKKARPELHAKIAGAVLVQATYGGSFVADLAHATLAPPVALIRRTLPSAKCARLDALMAGLRGVTTAVRREINARAPYAGGENEIAIVGELLGGRLRIDGMNASASEQVDGTRQVRVDLSHAAGAFGVRSADAVETAVREIFPTTRAPH